MMNIKELVIEIEKISDKDRETLRRNVVDSDCVFLLGNGGSSALCSHISEDYTKSMKKRSLTFTDPAQLTCYANDYGYENAYYEWLQDYVKLSNKPLVILVSSSGNSANIIKCAEHCIKENTRFVCLSGFAETNKLKTLAENKSILNYWVNSKDYGIVESVHQIFLHSII